MTGRERAALITGRMSGLKLLVLKMTSHVDTSLGHLAQGFAQTESSIKGRIYYEEEEKKRIYILLD